MKKPVIQIIAPERLKYPIGGLGVKLNKMIFYLSKYYDFDLVCNEEENNYENYYGIRNWFSLKHGTIQNLLLPISQISTISRLRKPDLVHAFDWLSFASGTYLSEYNLIPMIASVDLSPILLSKISNIKIAYDTTKKDGDGIQDAVELMEELGLKYASKVIHVSREYSRHMDYWLHKLELKNKSSVIPNGIDIEDFQNLKKVKLPGDRKYKIVYMGRFATMKNFDALLKAYLPNNIDLIFVGDKKSSKGQENISELIKEYEKRDGYYFIDPIYNNNRFDILHSADAVIFPSKHEPFGIIGLEAFASKTLLIASGVIGMNEYVHDGNYINCGISIDTIEESFEKLLSMNEKEKNSITQSAYSTACQFQWKDIVFGYKKIYDNLLGLNNG